MKLTRRKLAAAMLSAPAAVRAQTQPATQPTTQPATQPASQDAEIKAASERLRVNLNALANVKVPMAVEPAFQFKA